MNVTAKDNALPLISVIIPAYNAAATLEQACQSVLTQDYGNVELVVVNDGSTDETAQLLARLQQLSPPVFAVEGAEVQPDLIPAGLVLTEADKQRDFLCLWLEGRVLLLGRLERPDWR